MIGNDLVAFEACRHYSFRRWQAYWGRILTESEWENFFYAPNERAAWLYWAAKEAAWKVWNRRSAQRLLNPKSFQVKNVRWEGSEASFEVQGPRLNLKGTATINDDFLHAVVVAGNQYVITASVCPQGALEQSLNQDSFLTKHLYFNQPKSDSPHSNPQISLSRNILGIPSLEIAGNVLDLPISLSHHGSWAAYAYVYPHRTQP